MMREVCSAVNADNVTLGVSTAQVMQMARQGVSVEPTAKYSKRRRV